MQQPDERFDIVIAGGGTVGLALGCALYDSLGRAAKIALVDPGSLGNGSARDIRASALSAGSQHLLAALGIWPALAEHAQPVTGVDITDAALEDAFRPILVSYDNTVGDEEPATYIVENERLTRAILAGVEQRPGLRMIAGCGIAGHAAD